MIGSLRERQLRDAVIEAALRLFAIGLVTETSGNISVRSTENESMWITPSARDCRLLRARDVVRVELLSGTAQGLWKPSSEWRLHAAIYRVRPDVNAVIHHHGVWASTVAVARRTIPVLTDEAADIGPISTAPYGLSGSQELADAIAAEMANESNAVLLANHGAVAVGPSLEEAYRRAAEVERLARIYIGAQVLGGAHALDEESFLSSKEFFTRYWSSKRRDHVASCTDGYVRMQDVAAYAIRAGVTLASLTKSVVVQTIHRCGLTSKAHL